MNLPARMTAALLRACMAIGVTGVVGITIPASALAQRAAPAAPVSPAPTFQDRFITSEGRRIHCLDWGTAGKRPFIMLHGVQLGAHLRSHRAAAAEGLSRHRNGPARPW